MYVKPMIFHFFHTPVLALAIDWNSTIVIISIYKGLNKKNQEHKVLGSVLEGIEFLPQTLIF